MASLPSAWEDGEANREEYYARGICSFAPTVTWLLSILQHPLGSCMLLHNPPSLRLCYGAPVYALQPDITDNLTSLRATDSLFGTTLSHNLTAAHQASCKLSNALLARRCLEGSPY
jgi:hypothetical protein